MGNGRAHIAGHARAAAALLVAVYVIWFLIGLAWRGQFIELTAILGQLGIYAILAMSLNLACGMTGLLQLGHAGFFAAGAYAAGMFAIFATDPRLGWLNLVGGVVLGMAAAGLLSLVIGAPCLRLRGDYLAIATLAFGEIIRQILDNLYVRVDQGTTLAGYYLAMDGYSPGDRPADPIVIGGPTGIEFPQQPELAGGVWESFAGYSAGYAHWWVIWLLAAITYAIMRNIKRSRVGRALLCIREDEIAAQAMGINVSYCKILAFLLSAAFAGLAGALFFHKELMVAPGDFQLLRSIEVLLMVVLGGLGSFSGAMLAAVTLGVLPDVLRRVDISGWDFLPECVRSIKLGEHQALVYAVLLIFLIRLAPGGLLGGRELPASLERDARDGKEPA